MVFTNRSTLLLALSKYSEVYTVGYNDSEIFSFQYYSLTTSSPDADIV